MGWGSAALCSQIHRIVYRNLSYRQGAPRKRVSARSCCWARGHCSVLVLAAVIQSTVMLGRKEELWRTRRIRAADLAVRADASWDAHGQQEQSEPLSCTRVPLLAGLTAVRGCGCWRHCCALRRGPAAGGGRFGGAPLPLAGDSSL